MKRLLAASAAAAMTLTVLAGVQPSQAATSTLTYGVIADIKSFEARSSEFANRTPFYQAVYDTLAYAKPDGSLVPGLALSWKYDKSLTTLTLKLRKGIKFTNGETFNAAAVIANLLAFQKGDSPDASNAASIDTAVQGKTAMTKLVKGKKVVKQVSDPYTVVVNLKDIDPAFEGYLARNMGLMQAPSTIGTEAAKTQPVGTGPYVFDKAGSQIGASYAFTANPNYWNKSNRKFDALTIKVLSNATAAITALKAGQIDCINVQDRSAVPSLQAAGFNILTWYLGWAGFTFVDKGGRMGSPLKNVKVRQAINYAIDRPTLIQIMANGYGEPTSQVFASYSKGYLPALDNAYPKDIAKAKALMAEAGYANGFSLNLPSVAALSAAGYQAMKDQLAAIGITVNYTDVPLAEFFTQILTPKFPLYFMQLERNANDWTFIKFLINRDAVWNPSGYGDAKSDALLDKIQHSTGATQAGFLKQLNRYVVEQAWFAPFYVSGTKFAYAKSIKVVAQAGNAVPYLANITPA